MDELISWGLTNESFQRNVLNKINNFQRKTQGNKFINGFKAFLQSVTKLLFGGKSREELNQNGLAVLVMNTAGLLSAPVPDVTIKKTLKMAANSMTTEQVFDAVGALGTTPVSILHEAKLKGLIHEIVNKVRTPFPVSYTHLF